MHHRDGPVYYFAIADGYRRGGTRQTHDIFSIVPLPARLMYESQVEPFDYSSRERGAAHLAAHGPMVA